MAHVYWPPSSAPWTIETLVQDVGASIIPFGASAETSRVYHAYQSLARRLYQPPPDCTSVPEYLPFIRQALIESARAYLKLIPQTRGTTFKLPITVFMPLETINYEVARPFWNPELQTRGLCDIMRAPVLPNELAPLLSTLCPFDFPKQQRFEHQWIIANSGHGKTQTLQHLISLDLNQVIEGKCSIIVIDSQNVMIPLIAGLDVFGPGQELDGRLILIDPVGVSPPAVNLFSLQEDNPDELLKLFNLIFNDLVADPMTPNQRTLFDNCVLLLRHVPGATIRTMYDLLRAKDIEEYREYLPRLDEFAQQFFQEDFFSRGANGYEATKQQVLRRLNSLLRMSPFKEMLSCTQNKLDLYKEMESGKVILVNTADLGDGTRTFGRFFLALIGNVMRRRRGAGLPTFVYIDECDQYVRDDPTTIDLLARARKSNIGLIFAHRWLDELGQGAPKALESIASTIFAGGLRGSDARHMASVMDVEDPSQLTNSKKGLYTVHLRGMRPFQLQMQAGVLEAWPQMPYQHLANLKATMRGLYGVDVSTASQLTSQEPPPSVITTPPPPQPKESNTGDTEDHTKPGQW